MKKGIVFTDDELRTLIWMAQNTYASSIMRSHGKPTEISERILEIGHKAKIELPRRDTKCK